MVEGASGHIENDAERQVKTPWFEYEIPFTKAAAIGTQKVIRDHATIGFVVTTDGSVTDLPRESYIPAEEKTVKELQSIGKPFSHTAQLPQAVRGGSEGIKGRTAAEI